MAQLTEESLLQAIKNDDIKAFDAMMENTQCGQYRLGRFPVLSLIYLYNARKLQKAYERAFLEITAYGVLSEPMEISKKFSAKAGKCLRLYIGEIVSPIEMLLILDKTKRLEKVYPYFKQNSSAIKGRLKSIYYIKYSLSVKFVGDSIVIDRRPLSYREKRNIATAVICIFLTLVIVIGVPITVDSLMPKPVEGEVLRLKDIDFASDKVYTLKRNISIPDNYSAEEVNCTIVGEGRKLTFGKGASLGTLNGKLSGLTVESKGNPIFNLLSPTAVIADVTLNVNADVESKESTAFLATSNYGLIENVTLNVSGKINALASGAEATAELTFGGIVGGNYALNANYIGTVRNCVVNYSQFYLTGEASANAVFGAVAGVNNGYVENCKVTGEIAANTFDIAGICSVNNGLLSNDVNEARLSQTSADGGWNPVVCGIVSQNTNSVQKCQNIGELSAVSTYVQSDAADGDMLSVTVAGIVYNNSGTVELCKNSGDITADGKGNAYVGGIAAHSFSSIAKCLAVGNISVSAQKIYAGGILAQSEVTIQRGYVYFGNVDSCISDSNLNVSAEGENAVCLVGGIVGNVLEIGFTADDITTYYGGRVNGSYFIGSAVDIAYFGNIVGASGENIYDSNLFQTTGGVDYYNFHGNWYVDNSKNAFGTLINADGEYVSADENKGAEATDRDAILVSDGYKNIMKNF